MHSVGGRLIESDLSGFLHDSEWTTAAVSKSISNEISFNSIFLSNSASPNYNNARNNLANNAIGKLHSISIIASNTLASI